jgi:hypothetical protein
MTTTLCPPRIDAGRDADLLTETTPPLARLAALTELLPRIQMAETAQEACQVLAEEVQNYLGCQHVIVGLCAPGTSNCRLAAHSGAVNWPPHSEQARSARSALQEAVARGELAVWPPVASDQVHALLAHAQFARSANVAAVAGGPLRDERGTVRGAWLLAGSAATIQDGGVLAFVRAAEIPLATALQLLARAQRRSLFGLLRELGSRLCRGRSQAVWALLTLSLALLCIPVPHYVNCCCQLEPVTRRFAAAPFAAPLQQSRVVTGDLVQQGQVLAQLDGRDLRWELAGVRADLERATIEHAGHLASHASGQAEVTRHEVDRLTHRARLLEAREHDLDIRSPIDGLVVSGDLRDAEGMPVKVGQVLFEVAPLDKLVVELAIPEEDVAYVRVDMPVEITLDAFSLQRRTARVARVHPRAEIRDQENVFVAEVPLSNDRQNLYPGMRGRARIATGSARLGWLLFRRPAATMLRWLGW